MSMWLQFLVPYAKYMLPINAVGPHTDRPRLAVATRVKLLIQRLKGSR